MIDRLLAHELRRVSVEAETDPRTVSRVISGLPTRGVARVRVERALRDLGYGHLIPREQIAILHDNGGEGDRG